MKPVDIAKDQRENRFSTGGPSPRETCKDVKGGERAY
jgi:hypothetical protein